MSANKTRPATLSPHQVALVFEEIASTADIVGHLTSMLVCDVIDSEQDAAAVNAAVHKLTQRIGLLADLYGSRCGESYAMVVGGPDAWLMPRAFTAPAQG